MPSLLFRFSLDPAGNCGTSGILLRRSDAYRCPNPGTRPNRAFTLVELLVVIAVIGVLASLAVPAMSAVLENGRRSQCQARLANLGRGVLLYAQDHDMTLPSTAGASGSGNPYKSAAYTYTADILPYLGMNEETAKADHNTFRCPSRKYEPPLGGFERSHYVFNGANGLFGSAPLGLAGVRLTEIQKPSRTVLVLEASAAIPVCNHPFIGMTPEPDSKCWLFFVDGHSAYLPIHALGGGKWTVFADPPASYGYQWSPGPGPAP